MIVKLLKITALCAAFFVIVGISAYLTLTFIIKSEDTVIVPNLVGKDVVAALELLTDLQLNTKVSGSEYSQQYPKNHVTFQEPEAGSEIKKDRDVRIMISKGNRNILMPNLVALSERQARIIMEENGLSRGLLSRASNPNMAPEHIMAQAPAAGALITRGAEVNLLVSTGPRPVGLMMPDLAGLSVEKAVLRIEGASLNVGDIRSEFSRQKPLNVVIDQEPLAGSRVAAKAPIDLVINRPPGKPATANLYRSLYGSLLQYDLKPGYLKKRVKVELENENSSTAIYDDYVKPGKQLWILIPRNRDATVHIYEDDVLVKTRVYEAW